MQENFTILKQRAALERPTFPANPLLFRVPEPCLAAILDWRMIHGILRIRQETFLNDYLLEKDKLLQSSTVQRIWHTLKLGLDTEGNAKRPESEMRREPQNSSIPVPLFQSGGGLFFLLVELILTVVWLIIRDSRFRNCIWESFQTLWNFKAWKSISRLKHVQRQQILISQCFGSKKLR